MASPRQAAALVPRDVDVANGYRSCTSHSTLPSGSVIEATRALVSHSSTVAENVFAFSGTEVNWVLIQEGTELTLVDAGWDSDIQEVERSIRSLGRRPEDVRAVLLTHAHADHTGALNDNYGVPLYMDALEVPNARGETTESGGPMDVIKHAYRPQVVRWAAQMVKAGALKRFTFPSALPFPKEGPLDIPGRPVPVATHR